MADGGGADGRAANPVRDDDVTCWKRPACCSSFSAGGDEMMMRGTKVTGHRSAAKWLRPSNCRARLSALSFLFQFNSDLISPTAFCCLVAPE